MIIEEIIASAKTMYDLYGFSVFSTKDFSAKTAIQISRHDMIKFIDFGFVKAQYANSKGYFSLIKNPYTLLKPLEDRDLLKKIQDMENELVTGDWAAHKDALFSKMMNLTGDYINRPIETKAIDHG